MPPIFDLHCDTLYECHTDPAITLAHNPKGHLDLGKLSAGGSLAQCFAIFIHAEKIAVAEETVRLRSHVAQFRSIMEQEGAVGRKLDFLIQEFNRETNTIGSKAQDIEIARIVVDVKSEIEKIREQIQNIE